MYGGIAIPNSSNCLKILPNYCIHTCYDQIKLPITFIPKKKKKLLFPAVNVIDHLHISEVKPHFEKLEAKGNSFISIMMYDSTMFTN